MPLKRRGGFVSQLNPTCWLPPFRALSLRCRQGMNSGANLSRAEEALGSGKCGEKRNEAKGGARASCCRFSNTLSHQRPAKNFRMLIPSPRRYFFFCLFVPHSLRFSFLSVCRSWTLKMAGWRVSSWSLVSTVRKRASLLLWHSDACSHFLLRKHLPWVGLRRRGSIIKRCTSSV